jgi:hypothetical protein
MVKATEGHLTGSDTADFIKAGVAVEFTAEVDKEYTVKENVTMLTVVTLTDKRRAGLFPEGSEGASPAAQDKSGSAAGGNGIANPAPADKDGKKAEKPTGAGAVEWPGTCAVRGTVQRCEAGKFTVETGKGTVKADLADDAQIAVDMADISHAKKGDAITMGTDTAAACLWIMGRRGSTCLLRFLPTKLPSLASCPPSPGRTAP